MTLLSLYSSFFGFTIAGKGLFSDFILIAERIKLLNVFQNYRKAPYVIQKELYESLPRLRRLFMEQLMKSRFHHGIIFEEEVCELFE